MTPSDCEEVTLPTYTAWGNQPHKHAAASDTHLNPPAKIISLLLAKLGDFLTPGEIDIQSKMYGEAGEEWCNY